MSASGKESRFLRILKALGRSTLTLGVGALASLAIIAGVGFLNARAEAVPEPDEAASLPVEVIPVVFENGYSIPRRFIGQIEPGANVSLSFELGGRLDAVLVQEGDRVTAGQELARLDTDLLHAEATRLTASRAASEARLIAAEARLERATRLNNEGFSSQETLDQARATHDELISRIAEIDAALQSVTINLQKSVLYAPVSGQVAAQNVDTAETVQAGQEILAVLDTTAPEFRVGLPLEIRAEDLSTAKIEVAGKRLPAKLKTLRPDIDPVTRTRTALFDVSPAEEMLFGQTAALRLETEVSERGMWVPLDALQSGKGSVWGVMVVDGSTLHRATVEVLHVNEDRAYVRGTVKEGDQLVVSGAHRIVPGQTARILAPSS